MADALILTKRDDGVAIVSTNDDPLNRMTLEYVDMFSEAVEDIAADDSIRSFVVTAEGTTNFSVAWKPQPKTELVLALTGPASVWLSSHRPPTRSTRPGQRV